LIWLDFYSKVSEKNVFRTDLFEGNDIKDLPQTVLVGYISEYIDSFPQVRTYSNMFSILKVQRMDSPEWIIEGVKKFIIKQSQDRKSLVPPKEDYRITSGNSNDLNSPLQTTNESIPQIVPISSVDALVFENETVKKIVANVFEVLHMDYFDFLFDRLKKPFRSSLMQFKSTHNSGVVFHIRWCYVDSKEGVIPWFYPFENEDELIKIVELVQEVINRRFSTGDIISTRILRWKCNLRKITKHGFLSVIPEKSIISKNVIPFSDFNFDFSPIFKKTKENDDQVDFEYKIV
jgi:hypothetical protein